MAALSIVKAFFYMFVLNFLVFVQCNRYNVM